MKKLLTLLIKDYRGRTEKIKKKTPQNGVIRGRLVKTITGLIVIILCYILLAPFFPLVTKYVKQRLDATNGYKYISTIALKNVDDGLVNLRPTPKVNTLVIPKIGVDTPILEGPTEKTLSKGIWRPPYTSTPNKGGNTVITGHRYQYTSGPNTFYSLDKVKMGDKIIVFWEGKEYIYTVTEIKVVPPTAIEIEDNTQEPIITIYSCTPLFTQTNRLVVIGKLDSEP